MKRIRSMILWTALSLGASVALAASLAQVEADSSTLSSHLAALELVVDACPDGDCPQRAAIEIEMDALEQDLDDVVADRATLDPCSNCGSVDSQLAQASSLAATMRHVIGSWEDDV